MLLLCKCARLGLSLSLAFTSVAAAQAPIDSASKVAAPKPGGDAFLKVTINPSTSQIVEGAAYGLSAELQNISNQTISVDTESIYLSTQPEMAPIGYDCTWFYKQASPTDELPPPLLLQPGDRSLIFFDLGRLRSKKQQKLDGNVECEVHGWARFQELLNFAPGNFSFSITGRLKPLTPPHVAPMIRKGKDALRARDPAVLPEPVERVFTASATLPVVIPQWDIVQFSALGGLLAALVSLFRSPRQDGSAQARTFLIGLRNIAGGVLTSVTVTVLASRLSTTAFPIKVSVNDFWGAMTVGFVAFFIGGKFIDKLVDSTEKK